MDQIYELLAITLGAILANNFIFSQFLGICPFLGVSKKVDTAVGMGITGGLGFLLAIVLFASIRERLVFADHPKCWDGFPIALVTAGLIALAFMGFSGLQVWPM